VLNAAPAADVFNFYKGERFNTTQECKDKQVFKTKGDLLVAPFYSRVAGHSA
jgi:hypothetical protein